MDSGNRRQRRGSSLMILSLGMTLLFGLTALVVDLGRGIVCKNQRQAIADAAVLAATPCLLPPENPAGATALVLDWVKRNDPLASLTSDDVRIWRQSSGQLAVSVTWQQSSGVAFARLLTPQVPTVTVAATATITGIRNIPSGALPLALPTYQDAMGDWLIGSTFPLTYQLMNPNGGTPITLRAPSSGGQKGNFMALSIGGTGASNFSDSVINGIPGALTLNQKVSTETGNMVGPTVNAFTTRLASGKTEVMIPLIPRSEWEKTSGRSEVTIIGFVMARLTEVRSNGEVLGQFMNKLLYAPTTSGSGAGIGAYGSRLIPTP